MIFSKNFLPGDVDHATKELECLGYLLGRTLYSVEKGSFDIAERDLNDAMRSLGELVRMSEEKVMHDRLAHLIHNNRKVYAYLFNSLKR